MSSVSPTTVLTASTTPTKIGAAAESSSAPLAKVLPYLKSGLSLIVSLSKSLPLIFQPLLYPIPAILYILAPVTLFLSYLAFAFFLAPYRTVVYLLDALHPLYVFCGVACLTGGLLGIAGRLLSTFMISVLDTSQSAPLMKKEAEDIEPTRVKFES